jgi:L-lactate dehydrogenase complex protein LldG
LSAETGIAALLADFQDKTEALGVAVLRIASSADVAGPLADWATSLGADQILVAEAVAEHAPEAVASLELAGHRLMAPGSPESVRDAPLGVSLATLAVAETGSVLLAERELADRAVSMLTLALAVICPTRVLVASLDEAMFELQRLALAPGGSFATLLTGPSRTADIERVLTVGVQGPGKVMILFVDDL